MVVSGYLHLCQRGHFQAAGHHSGPRCSLGLKGLDRPTLLPLFVLLLPKLVELQGQWGNTGTTNCWWYLFFPECEIVDRPGGNVRDDVLSAASILSVRKANIASNVQIVPPKFWMTGPLSVRSHLPLSFAS